MSNSLIISDTQHPYEHPDALDFVIEVWNEFECDEAYHVGDELDLHAFSMYVCDPDLASPGYELQEAIEHLRPWYEAFPEMKICHSNHVGRLNKKARKAGLPRKCIRSIKEIIEAPEGWEWADSWEVQGAVIEHGHELFGRFSIPKTALSRAVEKNWQSTIFGHAHSVMGVQWSRTPQGIAFGMGVGCLVDENSYAFDYAGSKRKKTSQLGCGVLLDGNPIVVPMRTDKHGRWIGKL